MERDEEIRILKEARAMDPTLVTDDGVLSPCELLRKMREQGEWLAVAVETGRGSVKELREFRRRHTELVGEIATLDQVIRSGRLTWDAMPRI